MQQQQKCLLSGLVWFGLVGSGQVRSGQVSCYETTAEKDSWTNCDRWHKQTDTTTNIDWIGLGANSVKKIPTLAIFAKERVFKKNANYPHSVTSVKVNNIHTKEFFSLSTFSDPPPLSLSTLFDINNIFFFIYKKISQIFSWLLLNRR